jgi:hypothetical protein
MLQLRFPDFGNPPFLPLSNVAGLAEKLKGDNTPQRKLRLIIHDQRGTRTLPE